MAEINSADVVITEDEIENDDFEGVLNIRLNQFDDIDNDGIDARRRRLRFRNCK